MFIFFKFLELFILKILFTKDEYNINSKNFNPLRFFTIIILCIICIFNFYLIIKVSNFYEKVYEQCPNFKITTKIAQSYLGS